MLGTTFLRTHSVYYYYTLLSLYESLDSHYMLNVAYSFGLYPVDCRRVRTRKGDIRNPNVLKFVLINRYNSTIFVSANYNIICVLFNYCLCVRRTFQSCLFEDSDARVYCIVHVSQLRAKTVNQYVAK